MGQAREEAPMKNGLHPRQSVATQPRANRASAGQDRPS